MSVAYTAFFIISLLFGVVAFVAADSLIIGLGVFGVFLFSFFFIAIPMVKKYAENERKRHECYSFCNSFLITLSVCDSIEKSFDSATQNVSPEFKKIIDCIETLTPREKVDYLSGYFESDIYDMFLSVFSLYLEQGGDVLNLSSQLMEELTRIEENGESTRRESIKNMFGFVTLWAMALAILAFLRFGLNSFYSYLMATPTFRISILVFYAFLLASILFYAYKFTGVKPLSFSLPKNKKPKKKKRKEKEA